MRETSDKEEPSRRGDLRGRVRRVREEIDRLPRPSRSVRRTFRWFQRLLRVVVVPFVAREHRPTVAIAWLAVIFFLPGPGLLLYLLFGEYGLRRSVRQHARLRENVDRETVFQEDQRHVRRPDLPERCGSLVSLTERLATRRHGGFSVLGGNRVELVTDSRETIDRLIQDVERARHHVHLLFFLYNGDATGRRLAEALAAAARRGVDCRVLVDPIGSGVVAEPSFFDEIGPWLEDRGVRVYPVLPLRPFRRPFARYDIRNHRKVVVVDGRCAYAGSINVHDDDFGLEDGQWHQATVRLEGPAAHHLQLLFVEDWYFAAGELLEGADVFPRIEPQGDVAVHTIPGAPTYGIDLIQHHLVASIEAAAESLWITTPYFVPDEPLALALRLAALRGVDVHLVLPEKSDRAVADAAARSFLQKLLEVGVEVHLMREGVLHAKTLTIDDHTSVIGSANFDRRSFYVNYEVNLAIYDPAFTRRLRRHQESYTERSTRLGAEWWDRRPASARLVDSTAKLLSPLL